MECVSFELVKYKSWFNGVISVFNLCIYFLNCFDNNDTVSNSFIWFHSKNETIKREVKLSFGTETMLISLSKWNLFNSFFPNHTLPKKV